MDEKYAVEAVLDKQRSELEVTQMDLQRTMEDVLCRKMIIEEMNENMLAHERESSEMATKLTLMKN